MRADNHGEGGILALMVLAVGKRGAKPASRSALVVMGLFGAGLLYGDGAITPAISVLSAIEGLHVATPAFDHLVLPITIAILCGLFMIQRRGTTHIGRVFGPVILVWFCLLAMLGIAQIASIPLCYWRVARTMPSSSFWPISGTALWWSALCFWS